MASEDSTGTSTPNGVPDGPPVVAKYAFQGVPPSKHIARMRRAKKDAGEYGVALTQLWIGLAVKRTDHQIDIGFSCNDGTYSMDFAVYTLSVDPEHTPPNEAADGEQEQHRPATVPEDPAGQAEAIASHIVYALRRYAKRNFHKFLGAGISQELVHLSPQTPSRLWAELDIVPIIITAEEGGSLSAAQKGERVLGVDELADSLARKCLGYFGPNGQPRVQVGFNNEVQVDLDGRAHITELPMYQETVNERTWRTALKYADALKTGHKRFAYFSATPQGGGVALMRHALIRFYRLLGVECSWWVPKPRPEVFRITKTNHNILQGVAAPDARLTTDQQQIISDWIHSNAERFWTRPGGPLAPRSQGGVDVVFVDDPQMPNIVDIAKQQDPTRPVVFRDHIQIRADLTDKPETPTAEVWNWVWQSAQHADLFITHPVAYFVPSDVPAEKLAYMPAATDWLDGLNKEISDFDTQYYLNDFNAECSRQMVPRLAYPARDYIIQIARFDPSKGIPDVIASYATFRRSSRYCQGKPAAETPQLVICGHASVDDPDGAIVLNETFELLDSQYQDIKDSVVVARLGPVDQLLDVLMSNAKVSLQLSTREGFEIKVSEALHTGVPVIASTAGGIPQQVQHGKSGFLVEPGDSEAVAKYLDLLFSDDEKYHEMSHYAASHVSDEVGTVGNAICWMYLADRLSRSGEPLQGNRRYIWDLAREEAGEPVQEGEDRLRRDWA